MSQTEIHIGKFEILARGEEAIKEYLDNHPEIEHQNYKYIENRNYEIIYKYIRPGYDYILIRFLEHEKYDEDRYLEYYKKNEDETISFAVQFYNGGCCLSEALGGFEDGN